jgi:hypothetical protein
MNLRYCIASVAQIIFTLCDKAFTLLLTWPLKPPMLALQSVLHSGQWSEQSETLVKKSVKHQIPLQTYHNEAFNDAKSMPSKR